MTSAKGYACKGKDSQAYTGYWYIYKNLVLSNELIKVELPPWKVQKADVWSVSPSSFAVTKG